MQWWKDTEKRMRVILYILLALIAYDTWLLIHLANASIVIG